MIYTSYFANIKKLPPDMITVSISAKAPSWYEGFEYKNLSPSYSILMEYKAGKDENLYIKRFKGEILNKRNSGKVIEELYDLLDDNQKYLLSVCNCPSWENNRINICLLCYEKPDDFCHRHLVSEWLREYGYQVKEFNGSEK